MCLRVQDVSVYFVLGFNSNYCIITQFRNDNWIVIESELHADFKFHLLITKAYFHNNKTENWFSPKPRVKHFLFPKPIKEFSRHFHNVFKAFETFKTFKTFKTLQVVSRHFLIFQDVSRHFNSRQFLSILVNSHQFWSILVNSH